MRADWALRRRWHLLGVCLLAAGALLGVVLLSGGSPEGRETLLSQTSEPAPTTAPTSMPTSSAAPTASAPSVEPSAPAQPSPRPEPGISEVSPSLLLPTDYVSTAFGQGRDPWVSTSDDPGRIWSCYEPRPFGTELTLARVWTWPGEVAVVEVIGEHSDVASAREKLRICSSERYGYARQNTHSWTPDLGDEAFLFTATRDAMVVTLGGVRLGRFLVIVEWRQSGTAFSPKVAERALRDAVARATGQSVRQPDPAPVPRPGDFASMPQQADLGAWADDPWRMDLVLAQDKPLSCGGAGMSLTTKGPTLLRSWEDQQAVDHSGITNVGVGVTRTHVPDATIAEQELSHCRQMEAEQFPGTVEALEGLGDQAFRIVRDGYDDGLSHTVVWVRRGDLVVVITSPDLDRTADVALARVAIDHPDTG